MYRKPVKHSFKVFSEDLKNDNIGSVLLMYGVEQYLVKWAVESLVKKFVNPQAASMDFVQLDEEGVSCSEIIQACETFSMFSSRRIVWVKNFKPLNSDSPRGYTREQVKELADYVGASNGGTILIFSAEEVKLSAILPSALKKHGQCYDFSRIDKAELRSFAVKRFRAAGTEISPDALALLIEATGYFNKESDYRLYHFEHDIQKVIAHSDGRRIDKRDIEEAVCGDMDTFVFDMLDAITGNRKDAAFSILYNILHSGREPFSVIGAIVSQFELLLSVKEFRDDGMELSAMHKKLGGSEYRIKKMLPYAGKYSKDKLSHTLSSIYEVDRQIKTGLLDSQTALELFIAGI
ncbi:MAG: DNA polymerase III subunit delta [Emergencia sp.]|nr:DNA polymerase III subunit delta [Emergencia sp.]